MSCGSLPGRTTSAALVVAALCLTGAHPGIDHAHSLLLAGDRVGARTLLDSLLTSTSLDTDDQAEASYLRALLADDASDMERRLRRYLNGSGKKLQSGTAALRLGRHAYARGEIQTALKYFMQARSEGRDEEGSLWAGLCASVLNDFGQAEELLGRAAGSGSAGIRQRAWMALGGLHSRRQQWDKAGEYFEQVRQDPVQTPGWWSSATLRLAGCKENRGDTRVAQELRLELLDEEPDGYEAPFARTRMALEVSSAEIQDVQIEIEGFALQVGAFSRREGAESLADTLRSSGVERVRVVAGGELFRVFLEGFRSREQAEAAGDSLSKEWGLGYSVRVPSSTH